MSSDFKAALHEVQTAVAGLAQDSGLVADALFAFPAFLGLAGVTGPEMATRVSAALPFDRVQVVDDRAAALVGALGQQDGAIAHCGTGSFLASRIDGQTRFAGGWGPVLGDEASAVWVGRRLLSETLKCVDGFEPYSDLTTEVVKRYGDAPGVVRFAAEAAPSVLGQLAKMVTLGAESSDQTAERIMKEAASYLAHGLQKIGWAPHLTMCLTGGIASNYLPYLPEEMRAAITAPVGRPIDGAEALAFALARENRA